MPCPLIVGDRVASETVRIMAFCKSSIVQVVSILECKRSSCQRLRLSLKLARAQICLDS